MVQNENNMVPYACQSEFLGSSELEPQPVRPWIKSGLAFCLELDQLTDERADDQRFVRESPIDLLFERAIPMIYVFDLQAEVVREISE